MKLKLTFVALLVCCATALFAQTSGEHCVAFKASVESSVGGITLNEQQQNALTSKINQILSRNNAATTSLYSGFAVSPQISILSEETMNSGIRPVTTITAELTLMASNIVDNSNYGAVTLEIKVAENSKDQAVTAIINNVRPADPRITKFVKNAIERITEYYTMNMPTILRKTETLMAGNKYEEAMMFLESIPTCVPAYEQSSDAIKELYKVIADKSCTIAVATANRYMAIEDYESAKEVLLGVGADSDCNNEITELLKQINALSKVEEAPAPEPMPEPTPEPMPAPAPAPAPVVEAAPAPAPAPAPVATYTISNPLKDIYDIELLSCTGDATTNIVMMEFLVKNKTDLAQTFYSWGNSSLLYNSTGDEFKPDWYKADLELRPEQSRKFTMKFVRVPAKNSIVTLTVEISDRVSGRKGVMDIKNVPVKW